MGFDVNIDFQNMDNDTVDLMVNDMFQKKNFAAFKKLLTPEQRELIEGFEESISSPMLSPEQVKAYTTSFKMCMVYCMENTMFIPETTVSELKEINKRSRLHYADYYKAFMTWFTIAKTKGL